MRYRREIDGLRALAVFPVILFHAGIPGFSGGFVGVDIFFVISGYLITTILLNDFEAGSFSLIHFYERRARRILPALFLVIIVSLPFAWYWFSPREIKSFSETIIAVLLFSSNILFWKTTGYFDPEAELNPFVHTWSLSVEEQFYLLFPLFMLIMWRWNKRWIFSILTVTAVISFIVAHLAAYTRPSFAFYMLPSRAWELAIGSLIALYYSNPNIKQHKHWHAQYGSLLGISLIVLAVFTYGEQTPFPSLYALVPTAGAALIIIFSTNKTRVGKLLGSKLFVGLGLISYSAYLWHQPLFVFARKRSLGHPSIELFCAFIALTFVFAYMSWRFVERPFRNKNKISMLSLFIVSFLLSFIIIGVGFFGYLSDGNVFRYSNSEISLFGSDIKSDGYVMREKNKRHLVPFDELKTKRILIVGDSNSGDFINAFLESGLTDKASISTYNIISRCGNLAVLESDIQRHINSSKLGECRGQKRYADPAFVRLLREADLVILASNWQDWEADLIAQSMVVLRKTYGNKFIVFGTKRIEFNLGALLGSIGYDRTKLGSLSSKPEPQGYTINAKLSSELGYDFINPYDFLCPSNSCRIFDDHGELLYYDGFHLTRAGAKYLGERFCMIDMLKRKVQFCDSELFQKSLPKMVGVTFRGRPNGVPNWRS